MPRFNQKRWRPYHDTTPGFKTVAPDAIVLQIGGGGSARPTCPCGCAETPKGARAEFLMGHDARLRGKLIRAHMTGTEIVYVRGDPGNHTIVERGQAVEFARRFKVAGKDFTWEHYLDEAVERREGKNREVLQRALGSKRLVTVGRWEYTGQVVAVYRLDGTDMVEIEYVTKAGTIRKTKVPKDETMPAREDA